MIAPLVAICLVPLIGVLALVLDGGLAISARRQGQAGADAAALAAAGWLYSNYATTFGLDPTNAAKAIGHQVATDNGVTAVINIPPTSGQYIGQPGYAEAIVTINQPRLFSAIWGSGNITIQARSVAEGANTVTPYSKAAVILLDQSSPGALTLVGSASLTANAAVQVDSNSASALTINNSGKGTATAFNIVGNYKQDGPWSPLNGTINTGSATVIDPMASLPPVPTAGLTTYASSGLRGYGSQTINPGIYQGGLTVGGGQTVTMNPGVYYMKGGSLDIANGATVTGNGVTIYVDNGGGGVSFQGGANVNLSAATTGAYAGVVIYMDRNSTQPINLANGTSNPLTGTIYAAGSQVTFAGGSSTGLNSAQLICKTLNMTNNAAVNVTWNAGTVARAQTKAYQTVE